MSGPSYGTAKPHIDSLEAMLKASNGIIPDEAEAEIAAIFTNFDQRLTEAEKGMDRVLARLGVE